jgi:hypothetical protein
MMHLLVHGCPVMVTVHDGMTRRNLMPQQGRTEQQTK